MNSLSTLFASALAAVSMISMPASADPADAPVDLPTAIEWPKHWNGLDSADLTETTSNRINDLVAHINKCDFFFSTPGNYHMALAPIWNQLFLPHAQAELGQGNWFYTTSPPVSKDHIRTGEFVMGNLRISCVPNVAAGPKAYMEGLKAAGYIDSYRPMWTNSGNVMVVKAGNPKNIRSIWDLSRPDVTVTTSHPTLESGSYRNFRETIREVAYNLALPELGAERAAKIADEHVAAVHGEGVVTSPWIKRQWSRGGRDVSPKYVKSERIMHRNVFWSVAHGSADVTVTFRHLAVFTDRIEPAVDVIPLGGTVERPDPLPGNKVATMFIAKVKNPHYSFTETQDALADKLIEVMLSDNATPFFAQWGLNRPTGFQSTGYLPDLLASRN